MYGWQAEDAARRGTARVGETSGLIRCMSACRPRQVLVTETWSSFPGKPEMIPHQSMRSCHEKAAVEWLLSRQQAGLMLSSYLMPVYKSSMPNGDQTTSNLTSIAGNGYHVWRLSFYWHMQLFPETTPLIASPHRQIPQAASCANGGGE